MTIAANGLHTTARQAIVQAAAGLDQPFTFADLAVAAWMEHPQHFGMRGYPQHPDTRRVMSALCSRYGPLLLGVIEKVGRGRYRVRGKPAPRSGECRHAVRWGECATCAEAKR